MDVNRIRTLINKREEIDQELVSLITGNGNGASKRPVVCSNCKEEGHTARTCTKRTPPDLPPFEQEQPPQ